MGHRLFLSTSFKQVLQFHVDTQPFQEAFKFCCLRLLFLLLLFSFPPHLSSSLLDSLSIYLFVCVCVCVGIRIPWHECGGQRTTSLLVLSFHTIGPRDQIQMVSLGSSCLYLLNRLAGLFFTFSFFFLSILSSIHPSFLSFLPLPLFLPFTFLSLQGKLGPKAY